MTAHRAGDPQSARELKWLRAIAEYAPAYRDSVIAATRNMPLALGTITPMMKAKAKLEGALNELRIAREGKS